MAARIATDQLIDLRYTLMYLGVPVRSQSYMFGDNKSVADSASIPTSTLFKKSNLASYHSVGEVIAAGYLPSSWKDGKSNPADILSNIGSLQTSDLSRCLYSSGSGAHMSSLPRQGE